MDERQTPATAWSRSRSRAAREHAELVAGPLGLGRDAPVLSEPLAVEQPEDRLCVADVDGQEHRLAPGRSALTRVAPERLTELLGERLGREHRLVAVARAPRW